MFGSLAWISEEIMKFYLNNNSEGSFIYASNCISTLKSKSESIIWNQRDID